MKTCLFVLLAVPFFGRLFFKSMPLINGGAVNHLYKDKKQIYLSGEDGHCTTHLTLSVADGVGSSNFLSYHIANILAFQASIAFLEILQTKKLLRFAKDKRIKNYFWWENMLSKIKEELQEYRKFSQRAYSNSYKEKIRLARKNQKGFSLNNLPSVLKSSTTLASCAIDDTDFSDRKLLIVQKGDSRIAVLRPKLNPSKSGYYYSLVFLSKDMQIKFNQPYQFGVLNEDQDSLNNEFDEFKIEPRDIVLVGSDGFFDNLHISIITHAVNFLARKFSLSMIDPNEPETLKAIKELAEKYAKIFEQPETDKDRNQEDIILEERGNRNPKIVDSDPKEKKSGGFLSGFWCCGNANQKTNVPKKIEADSVKKKESKIPTIKTEALISAKNTPEIVRSIFQCPPSKIIQEFSTGDISFNEIFYSDCVLQGLESEFSFSEEDLLNFEKYYHSRYFAEHLKNIALHLSNQNGYPSPFFLANYSNVKPMSSLAEMLISPYKSGKPDDITIMSGLVLDAEGLFDPKIDEYSKELQKKKESLYNQLKADIENFVKEHNNEGYEVMHHQPFEKKQLKASIGKKYRIL